MNNFNQLHFMISSCTKLQFGIGFDPFIFTYYDIRNKQNHVQMLWVLRWKQIIIIKTIKIPTKTIAVPTAMSEQLTRH